jgi:2-polyprenyl-3-methyl-5-hydroxy-6-metoxy-1,4-benzoquinol methylase
MLAFVPADAKRVLDVGCSSGTFGQQLRQHREINLLVGVEPNEEAATRASSVYDKVLKGLFPEVVNELPDSSKFDVVFFNDVIEHMPSPYGAIAATKDLLAPGGILVASIPNVRHISVVGPLILRDEFRYRDSGILDTTHLRFFTGKTIRRLFADEGWEILEMSGINRVLRIAETKKRWWISTLSRISRGRSDAFFYVQYVVVARPKPW